MAADTLFGRDEELAALDRFLRAIAEQPAALALEGEAGVGKTVLWRAAVEGARGRSYRVLTAQPTRAESRLSFTGLGDLLVDVAADVLPALPPPQRRALAVALLLEAPAEAPPDHRAIGLGLLGALRLLAAATVLVAIDDLHWLDRSSAAALGFAFRRLRQEPVGLLAALRTEEREADRLAPEAGLPADRLLRLSLAPLSLGAIHALLAARLGEPLPRPMLLRIHEASGGNPFFALEIGRALREQGYRAEPGRPIDIPRDVDALFGARLARLPAAAREVLPAVAALAAPSASLVEAAAPRPERAVPGLEAAIDAGVIQLDGERLRFSHPLLASAVYRRLAPARRRELHRRLAGVVADLEERARHLALAADGPDEAVAAALEEAGERAARRGAPHAAAEFTELAVRLSPADEPAALRRRKLQAAHYYLRSGASRRSTELLQELLTSSPSGPDRSEVLLRLADAGYDRVETALHFCEQAIEHAQGDGRLLNQAHRRRSTLRLFQGDAAGALAEAHRALEVAEGCGDPELLVRTLAHVTQFELLAGRITPGVLERLQELGRGVPCRPSQWHPDVQFGQFLMNRDRLHEARSRLEPVYAEAAAQGDVGGCKDILVLLTLVEVQAGAWQRAERYASELFELVQQLEFEDQSGMSLYPKALVAAHAGRVGEARAVVEQGVALSDATGDTAFRIACLSVLGFLELSLREFAAADRILRPLAESLAVLGWGEPNVFRVLPNAIEALIGLGELEVAAEFLARLEEQATTLDSPWAISSAARCRGLLRAAQGDLAGALAAFDQALAEHVRMPEPFEQGRNLLALGATLRRARLKGRARRALQQALAIFEQLPAPLWAQTARAELGRIGGRAPASAELTPAEAQVARLAAAGRTNREVAAALFVTLRTVETHLSSIYAKLGVRSRTELARLLAVRDGDGSLP